MKIARTVISLVLAILAVSFVGCNFNVTPSKYKRFEDDIITKSNGVFSDLGNYIVMLDEIKEIDFAAATTFSQTHKISGGGACTACAKLNSKGEVIIGRNLDMPVSYDCAFVVPTSAGRYKTEQIRFITGDYYTYEEFKTEGYKDKEFINYVAAVATDAMNEKGLYIEANVREANEGFQSTGTNPGKENISYATLVAKVAQNCATVKEALNYLRNDVNYVSREFTDNENPTDYGYMIGDATGEFGVIEIVKNEVFYLPYQSAQSNYYLNPIYNPIDNYGSGYGRYEMALDGLENADSMEDMYNQIGKAMWRNQALYSHLTYKDADGKPVFVDDKGNKVADWRSDFYMSQLKEYYGEQVINDNFGDQTSRWMMDDANLDTVLLYCKDYFKNIGGDVSLQAYYAGDDDIIRRCENTLTTGVRFGINCKRKTMMMTFFERDNLTYEFTF